MEIILSEIDSRSRRKMVCDQVRVDPAVKNNFFFSFLFFALEDAKARSVL